MAYFACHTPKPHRDDRVLAVTTQIICIPETAHGIEMLTPPPPAHNDPLKR